MIERIRHAITMCEKYFSLYKKNPYYILAVLLSPNRRLEYLKDLFKGDALELRDSAEKLWLALKHPNGAPAVPRTPARRKQAVRGEAVKKSKFAEAFDKPLWRTKQRSSDEFNDFTETAQQGLSSGVTALQWWCEEAQRTRWPLLSQLAINTLSIPASSAEDERVFSGARRTVSWERSQIGPTLLKQLECLKHWNKSGILY